MGSWAGTNDTADRNGLNTWVLRYEARPWLVNTERAGGTRGAGGRYGRATLTREWRDTFAGLCLVERVPALAWADITVTQTCADSRMPDTGNCYPAAKAAIDGLVDAGVLANDTGRYVHSIRFVAPQATGTNALEIAVTGPPADTSAEPDRKPVRAPRRRLPSQSPRMDPAALVPLRPGGVRNRQRRPDVRVRRQPG